MVKDFSGDLDGLRKDIREVYGKLIIKDIKKKYIEDNRIAFGDAINGWFYDEQKDDIYNETISAYILEYGRLPNNKMPPVNAIYEWLLIKGTDKRKAKKIAYRIAKSIAKKGIKPNFYAREIASKYGWVKS